MSRATQLHHEAMASCSQAFAARRADDEGQAQLLFRQAFEREREAAEFFREKRDKEPTRSVLYRSAATLALECGDLDAAEALIRTGLNGNPPAAIAAELVELREEIDTRRGNSPLKLSPGETDPSDLTDSVSKSLREQSKPITGMHITIQPGSEASKSLEKQARPTKKQD